MQKLGIIGGIGPEATMNYYSSIIKLFQEKVGTDKELPTFTFSVTFEMRITARFDGGAFLLSKINFKLDEIYF